MQGDSSLPSTRLTKSDSLSHECTATVALAAQAVVSRAIFEGVDTTESSAEPRDIFENPKNHAAATASILTFAANKANFLPTEQAPKSLGSALNDFVRKVSTFPGFLTEGEVNDELLLNGSLDQFEEIIHSRLHDSFVTSSLRDLVPNYIEDESLTNWVLSLIVLSKPKHSDGVHIKLVRVSLTISRDEDGTANLPKQTASLIVSSFLVHSRVLSDNADRFAQTVPVHRVNNFIKFFASSNDDVIDHESVSCFTHRQERPRGQAILSW